MSTHTLILGTVGFFCLAVGVIGSALTLVTTWGQYTPALLVGNILIGVAAILVLSVAWRLSKER